MGDPAEHDQRPDRPAGSIQVRIVAPVDMSEAPSYYANFIQVGMSPYEFTVHFSRITIPVVSEPPAEPVIFEISPQPVASISIPLNLVRGFIRALEGQVSNWETTFHQSLPTEPSSAQPEPTPAEHPAQGVEPE